MAGKPILTRREIDALITACTQWLAGEVEDYDQHYRRPMERAVEKLSALRGSVPRAPYVIYCDVVQAWFSGYNWTRDLRQAKKFRSEEDAEKTVESNWPDCTEKTYPGSVIKVCALPGRP